MIEWLHWFLTNPLAIGPFEFLCGIGIGWMVGRRQSTKCFEIERDDARDDLDAVLRTFELKNVEPLCGR